MSVRTLETTGTAHCVTTNQTTGKVSAVCGSFSFQPADRFREPTALDRPCSKCGGAWAHLRRLRADGVSP